jgi:hypothetical protein
MIGEVIFFMIAPLVTINHLSLSQFILNLNIRLTKASKGHRQAYAKNDRLTEKDLGECQKPSGANTRNENERTTEGTL